MDESAVAALTAGNKALEERMMEMSRHNKAVEEVEKRRIELEEQREQRESLKLNLEQNRFKAMAWQGKNDELNYKMNLLSRYEEFRRQYGWSDEQIVAFYPDMAQVIQAKTKVPVMREDTQQTSTLTMSESQHPSQDFPLGQTPTEESGQRNHDEMDDNNGFSYY
jgi:predicted RNase H-like nuclease (RuvC/YqgF family)